LAIISVSGVRGVVNEDIDASEAARLALKFGNYVKGGTVAVAADTRKTAPILKNSIISALVETGCTVFDLNYSSTPSVFKEVNLRALDGGIIVTASHNPPEWNGMKFVIRGGRGVFEQELEEIRNSSTDFAQRPGKVFPNKPLYLETLRNKAGRDSANGVKVALDLAGGVGCLFIPQVIAFQGCIVHTLHSTPGIFPRIIDPTVDPLVALSNLVVTTGCDVGFAYDCDADRLVIVDPEGKKLSGDATLLICLRYFLENTRNRSIAISVDTSLAAEDLVREYNGKVVYSKVGEPNVVKKIIENNCGAGGEGSSGGYIEPSFLLCRDGVYASTMILKLIQSGGSLKDLVAQFSEYHQYRGRLDIDRNLAPKILFIVADNEKDADLTDGVKIRLTDKSWVLIRASNTENVIRVSAEAKSTDLAKQLVRDYTKQIAEIAEDLSKRSSIRGTP
jgi:phosphomannomutase